MTRTLRTITASALLVLLAGCAGSAPPEPLWSAADGDPLTAEVVEFEPDGDVGDPPPALSAAGPGRVFVAVAGFTHCRLPTGVEVRRSGDDLRVVFTGGVDHEECARPYRPAAVLGLAAADVAGVRTVDGRVPVPVVGR